MHWEYTRYDATPTPERKRHYCHVPSTGNTIGFGSEADARNQCEAYAREGVTSYVLRPIAQCNPKRVAYQPEWVTP